MEETRINALTWLVGWGVFLMLLSILARTEWGSRIVYYIAWLSVVFLLVTHYKAIGELLVPMTGERTQEPSF